MKLLCWNYIWWGYVGHNNSISENVMNLGRRVYQCGRLLKKISLKWNWRGYVWHNNSSSVNDTAVIFSKIELNGSKWDISKTPHWTRVIVSLANIWQRHQSLRGNIGWWCDSAMWFLLLHYQSLQRWPGLGLPCPVMVSKEGKEGERVYGVVALKWVNNGESGKIAID